jgi:hypothetical protein
LFQKATFEGKETKFEATLLLDKDAHAESIAEIQAAIKLAIKEKLGGAKVGADKLCMKDGDDSDYEGYAGTMSLKAANAKRPLVIDRDKTPLAESLTTGPTQVATSIALLNCGRRTMRMENASTPTCWPCSFTKTANPLAMLVLMPASTTSTLLTTKATTTFSARPPLARCNNRAFFIRTGPPPKDAP